jgi:hypothetical protein
VQLNTDGETAGGVSDGELEVLPDGRARLVERWSWESRSGSGQSSLEEVLDEGR